MKKFPLTWENIVWSPLPSTSFQEEASQMSVCFSPYFVISHSSCHSLQCGFHPHPLVAIHSQRSLVTLPITPNSWVHCKSWTCQLSFPKDIFFSLGRNHHLTNFLVSLIPFYSPLFFLVFTCRQFPKRNHGLSSLNLYSLHWRAHWCSCFALPTPCKKPDRTDSAIYLGQVMWFLSTSVSSASIE